MLAYIIMQLIFCNLYCAKDDYIDTKEGHILVTFENASTLSNIYKPQVKLELQEQIIELYKLLESKANLQGNRKLQLCTGRTRASYDNETKGIYISSIYDVRSQDCERELILIQAVSSYIENYGLRYITYSFHDNKYFYYQLFSDDTSIQTIKQETILSDLSNLWNKIKPQNNPLNQYQPSNKDIASKKAS